MNKIEKMLKELCPDGIEWKKLGEVCKFTKGQSITGNAIIEGTIPVIAGGKMPAYYHNISNRQSNIITVSSSGANAGYVAYWDIPIFASDCFTVDVTNSKILVKYIYYNLVSRQQYIYSKKSTGGIPHVYGKDLYNILIPIPPLEVQSEIVKILDNFTELQAELQARKKQYEYYRDKLLSFDNILKRGGVVKKLGEVATMIRGSSPRPIHSFLTNDKNGIPWIKIGDVATNDKYITNTKEKLTIEGSKKSKIVNIGDFILSNSMSFGRPYILKIKGCIHDGWISISNFEKYLLSDFLYYILTTTQIQQGFRQSASSGTVQNLNIDMVKNVDIPIPPLEVQVEIVNILDKFERMCNSLTEGLPSEIAARKKQYEYYRDKLLSFDSPCHSERL